jgi:pimeloyl-ACP methyl ester carboxylesterase
MPIGFKTPRCYAAASLDMSTFLSSFLPGKVQTQFTGFSSHFCEMMKAENDPFAVFKPTIEMVNQWRQLSSFSDGIRWRAFDTTIYHYPHADLKPRYPGINNDTKAVVIAFSGSGLTSASGRNFMQLANVMARHGVSLVSLDYPFHRYGPRDPKYMNADVFHTMAMSIVHFYKSTGLPVFLMGHSQGPLPIQELLHMEPALVSAAIMFSPGGAMSRRLLQHYLQQDAVGAFDDVLSEKTQIDDAAEAWEMAMDEQARTIDLNAMATRIPVWIVAGAEDPWSSPDMIRELAAKYPAGKAEVIPEVGHHIFHARLPNGKALMATRIVEMIEQVTGKKLPKLPKMNAPSKVLYSYKNSEMFRGWFASVKDRDITHFLSDTRVAKELLERWNYWLMSSMFTIFNPAPKLPQRPSPMSLKIWRTQLLARDAGRSAWTPNHVNRALKVFGEMTQQTH